jgi:hypothetical protein
MSDNTWIVFVAENPQTKKYNRYKMRYSQIEIIQGVPGEHHVWVRSKSGIWMRVSASWNDFNSFIDTIADYGRTAAGMEYNFTDWKAKYG